MDRKLFYALKQYRDNVEEITQLIIDGANVNAIDEYSDGYAPLHWAIMYGHPKTANALIAHKADVNTTTNWDLTPLHFVALYNRAEIARMLIAHGAIFNTENSMRRTPLHIAAFHNNTAVAKVLIAFGDNVDAKDLYENTPLKLAYYWSPPTTRDILNQVNAARENGEESFNLLKWIWKWDIKGEVPFEMCD